jgi:hypothetical protein
MKIESFTQENSDFIVVVYWSKFMSRQSQPMIKTLYKNLQRS